MLRMLRSRIDVKVSMRLIAVAIPLLAVAVWQATESDRRAVEQMILEKGRVAALSGARAYGAVLEFGLQAGEFTLDDLLDPTYAEIVPPEIPAEVWSHQEHAQYHTRYDQFTDDHGIQEIEDAILGSSPDFVFASGIDLHGYVPTPHRKYAEPPTGDWTHDRKVSRAKRRYDNDEQLAAARYVGHSPTLVQDYHRDTGELIWDVAAPIFVRGRHFGAFRVGVARDQINAKSGELALVVARVLGVAVILLAVAAFLTMRRAMRPLRRLAETANQISTSHDGEHLRTPIRATSTDEVGQMARSLERLRQSILIAFRQG